MRWSIELLGWAWRGEWEVKVTVHAELELL
jgi:hypothetical protein